MPGVWREQRGGQVRLVLLVHLVHQVLNQIFHHLLVRWQMGVARKGLLQIHFHTCRHK